MDGSDLKARTKAMALDAIRVSETLPRNPRADVLGRQFLRSATSVAANYRAACRARSTNDFISKLGIVEEEADETLLWLEMLVEAGIIPNARVESLYEECEQILRMVVASIKTARNK